MCASPQAIHRTDAMRPSAVRAAKQRAPRRSLWRAASPDAPRVAWCASASAGSRNPSSSGMPASRGGLGEPRSSRGAPDGGGPWRRARARRAGGPECDAPAGGAGRLPCRPALAPGRRRTGRSAPGSAPCRLAPRRGGAASGCRTAARRGAGRAQSRPCGRPRTRRARRRREGRSGSTFGRRGTGRARCGAGACVGCGCAAR